MAWLLASLRRLREAPMGTVVLALVIGVTAFVFGVAPRLLQTTADSVVRADVAAATVDVRSLEVDQLGRFQPGPADPFSGVEQLGQEYRGEFPASVDRLVSSTDLVVESARWLFKSPALADFTLRLRFEPAAASRMQFTTGVFPGAQASEVPGPPAPGSTVPSGPVPVFQVGLSTATAAALQAAVGDVIFITPDPTDPQQTRRAFDAPVLAVQVAGTFAETDPSDDYWFNDPALDHPTNRSISPLDQVLDATALVAPGAYAALLEATGSDQSLMRYRWRYTVDAGRLSEATTDGTVADLRRLEGLFLTPAGGTPTGASLQTGLLTLLEDHQARWGAAGVVLTVVAVGPAVIAAAALGLIAALTGRRRRSSLRLSRARGASRAQVWLSLALEGGLVAVPPAAVAALLAIAAVPDGRRSQTLAAATAVVVVAVLLVVATSLVGLGEGRQPGREGAPGRRASPRTLVLEGVAVLLAVAGAFLLLQRGVLGGSSTGTLTAADPFIAAVPALIGVAAGLVLRRLYPFVMRAAARVAGARRDLVPVMAMRRATRDAGGATILLVLLAAATLGTFASAILVHLDDAAEAIAWQDVGAPYALTAPSGPVPSAFAPGDLPHVGATSAAFLGPVVFVDHVTPVDLLALDPASYAATVSGTPVAQILPAAFTGAATGAVPVIVSTNLLGGPGGAIVGGTLQLSVGGTLVNAQVALARDTFPGIAAGNAFIIASRPQVQAAMGDVALPTRVWFLAAPPDAAADLRAALALQAPGTILASQAEEAAALAARPIVQGVAGGVTAAALVAAAYAGLAVIAALILAGAARTAEVAHLRLLGLTRRQVLGLVIVEHGPMVLASFAAGVALGLGIFLMLRPALGLEAVVGSNLAVALDVDPRQLAVLLGATVVVVAAGIAAGTLVQRHATPAAAVRGGLE